jgi:hypothetical protein
VLAIRGVRDVRHKQTRGLAFALIVWTLLFLAIYGTRLAAPGFVFGLAFALRAVPKSAASTTHG